MSVRGSQAMTIQSEQDRLRRIESIVSNPSQGGIEELRAMAETGSAAVKVAAVDAMLHIGLGRGAATDGDLPLDSQSRRAELDALVRTADEAWERIFSRR
jgi:hypothetical protein